MKFKRNIVNFDGGEKSETEAERKKSGRKGDGQRARVRK